MNYVTLLVLPAENQSQLVAEETSNIERICPDEDELKYIGPATCPTCNAVFQNCASCELHQIMKHNKKSGFLDKKKTERNVTCQYFCPVANCKYSKRDLNRFFSKMKYLRQHYLKSHAERKFACDKCNKSYSTQTQLSTHCKNECGVEFGCTQCDATYTSREALLTHCSRANHAKHSLLTKRKGQEKMLLSNGKYRKITTYISQQPQAPAHVMENIAAAALSELSAKAVVRNGIDASTQTFDPKPRRRGKNNFRSTKSQTENDRLFPEGDSLDMVFRQYFTSATQTNQNMDFDLGMFQDIDQYVNNETQTELPDNLMLCSAEECPALSTTQTQTATALDEYSHNCTQTCSEDNFLNDFVELSDIETQTAWFEPGVNVDSLLVSAETQTLL